MSDIELRLLGAHKLTADGRDIALKTKRSWALLAYMVANRDRAVPREEIAALLWDRSPEEQARASLRQELSSLRGALRAGRWEPIASTNVAVTFDAGAADVDVIAFERAVRGAAPDAFGHYGGAFLRDLGVPSEPFTRWQDDERARLSRLAVENETALLGREGEAAEGRDPTLHAHNILTMEPANERAWRELMRHHARTGRRDEALRQFVQCRRALQHELDALPSAETQQLADDIRDGRIEAGRASSAREASVSATAHGAPATPARAPSSTRRSPVRPWLTIGGAVIAAVALGGGAFGGAQYYADGQRYTQRNVLCALPLLRPADQGPIAIGAMLPMDVEHGKRLAWGVRKFMSDPPERFDFPYRVVYGDTTDGLDAVAGVLDDFATKNVLAVVGPLESRKAWDAKVWGNARKVPIVSPLASASYLAGVGGEDYFFRVTMSDGERAKALVQWLRVLNLHNDPYVLHETPPETPALGEPEIYGASQATAAKRHLQRAQTIRFVRDDEASNLAAADRVANDGRAVLIFGYTSNIERIIHRLQANGVENPIFLMGIVQKRIENAGFPMPDKLHLTDWVEGEANDFGSARRLQQDYLDSAPPGIEYDASAYYSYDTLQMVLNAVRRAKADKCGGYVTGEDVADELRRTPAKRRKVIHRAFMPATQEVHYEYNGLKIVGGRFRPVGLGE